MNDETPDPSEALRTSTRAEIAEQACRVGADPADRAAMGAVLAALEELDTEPDVTEGATDA